MDLEMTSPIKHAKNRMLAVNDSGHVIGEQHHLAKLTDHEVDLALELLAGGMSQALVAEKFEVSRRTIRDYAAGRRRGQTAVAWKAPKCSKVR